jgi:uncharacterized delta-60 repeat protein
MKTKLLTLKKQLFLLMLTLGSINIFAQGGALDTSFDPGTGADNTVLTTAVQADGKIVIGGDFTSYNGTGRNRIARLNEDGTLDNTFDPGTGANGRIWTTSIQTDGKIIIGGEFTSYNETGINRIARLNTDGTLDTSFNVGTGASLDINTISIQTDGKIIIGGGFAFYNGTSRNHIARLNDDGTLDTSFDPGTGASGGVSGGPVLTTAIQADGKIIIGGRFLDYNGTAINFLARLNADGTLDTSFDTGTGPGNVVRTISVQTDGKIIIGGDFTSYNGTFNINRIARLNDDGTLDASFNQGGSGPTNVVLTTAIQDDGKIIVGGSFSSFNGTSRSRIARLNDDGSLDSSFDPGTGANASVETTSIQTDGKIIIGGSFTSYNGTARSRIARLNDSETAGINENNAIAGLSVYPNPAKEKVIISLNLDAKYSLVSMVGQEVQKGELVNGDNTLDVSKLSKGMYFLNIESGNAKTTEKIIKQ